ncbi:mitochondrial large ribosomal subunit, partial [Coemansia erecta]
MFKSLTTRTATHTRLLQRLAQSAFESTAASKSAPPKFVTYPYFVARTRTLGLPVYTDVKKGSSNTATLVQRVEGDIELLRKELSEVLGLEIRALKVKQRRITIQGNHADAVREWLTNKG